jgi:outer membrane protein
MRLLYLLLLLVICDRCEASWDELEVTSYLSLGAAYHRSLVAPLDKTINGKPLLELSADLQYRNFFIESGYRRNVLRYGSGLLGYYLWRNQDSTLSVTTTSYNNAIGPKVFTIFGNVHLPELNGLELRVSDLLLGLRYQRFWQQHYVAIELGQDIASHYGQQLRLTYSYRQPLRNWDLYYNIGISSSTAKLVNYYFGVTVPESLADRPVYRASTGQQLHLGFSAVYPLSPDWLMELGLAVDHFSSAYTSSPLSNRDNELRSLVKFRYVF